MTLNVLLPDQSTDNHDLLHMGPDIMEITCTVSNMDIISIEDAGSGLG
jgi:hypothetical protein